MLGNDSVMLSRYLLSIMLLLLCHPQMQGQLLTKALPSQSPQQASMLGDQPKQGESHDSSRDVKPDAASIPDDPGQQVLPIAKPEPLAKTGFPVRVEALSQSFAGDVYTLTGEAVLYYKDYVVHADKIVYHKSTSIVEAEGHLQVEGGSNDANITASNGVMHLDQHTAEFYNVTGSFGVRRIGKAMVYSTPDPFIFTGRVLLQTGQDSFRIVDGTMTSCRLPKPDWQLIAHAIEVANGKATTRNSRFELLHVPIFLLPYLRRSLDETGRESGLLLPVFANSGVKGIVLGEQVYWAINRSMDLTVGAEYWSKRGFAPNGDFRYRGKGLDNLLVRWNGLLDRGIEETLPGNVTPTEENQGGADITASGRRDFTDHTRLAGAVEYLSSYIYRLAFDENLAQATSSEVQSDLALTHSFRGFVASASADRFQSFAGSTATTGGPVVNVPEVRVLHLPSVRFDVVDRPLTRGSLPGTYVYWGMGSSLADLDRAEPNFHARNVGRLDIYPHLEIPLHLGDWQIRPEFAARLTQYSGSQNPDLTGTHFGGVPTVLHDPLTRADVEATVNIRPPAVERDFTVTRWNREFRHVIEPELRYRYVTGINNARQTLHFDTTDIATNTNEAGFSLTQRLYIKKIVATPCEVTPGTVASNRVETDMAAAIAPNQEAADEPASEMDAADQAANGEEVMAPAIAGPAHPRRRARSAATPCKPPVREWASWQIAQKYFIDPNFGGALIPDRRNIFDATLDLTGVAYLTSPRNISPIISRVRFEAIDNLRVEWDLDYDTKAGRLGANNLFAGYSFGRTTVGVGHALLNAADENGSKASLIKSQLLQPFLFFGKPSDVGLSVALSSSYDFTNAALQYGGVEAIYNWKCCGLNVGYRRFALGSLRDESEWLYGFTLSGLGTAGNIRRSTSVFPTADALKRLY
jgi:LPS-assembly protein